MSAPGVAFYPQSATEFINYTITTGAAINLSFKPQGNGFSVSVQSSAAVSVPAKSGTPKLPDNAAGRIVATYIKAFNSGDEKAMEEFLQTHLSKTSLANRSMKERLEIYQRLRGDLGDLSISSVTEANEQGLVVTFQTATGKTPEFTFDLDPAEPQKLKGLRIELR